MVGGSYGFGPQVCHTLKKRRQKSGRWKGGFFTRVWEFLNSGGVVESAIKIFTSLEVQFLLGFQKKMGGRGAIMGRSNSMEKISKIFGLFLLKEPGQGRPYIGARGENN